LSPLNRAISAAKAKGRSPIRVRIVTASDDGRSGARAKYVRTRRVGACAGLTPRRLGCCGAATTSPAVPPEVLAPPPAWVWWDHEFSGLWPPADDRPFDLNTMPPTRVDEAAH